MEYVILGLLMIQPSTLYSLNKAFEQGISLFFSPSLGSINSAVKRLIEKGHVSQSESVENGRVKKGLTITESGRQAFFEWMDAPLDSKNIEVSFLSRLYFLGLIEDDAHKKSLVQGMYACAKASKEVLDEVNENLDVLNIPEPYRNTFKYQMKVLKYGIDTHDYALKWIEALIKEL